ncbi:hypothetical protein BOSEA1005_11171 [Hyphomicrobiales bacterium]|nr:hypothetical protein BOSEA1005_11171 [Hyphomicrobiales bacterium]CAI0347769.1 hypothetical protein BO1005MUT1_90130 [Hyphomicrobiales bacterium]
MIAHNDPFAAGDHVSRPLRELRFPAGARRLLLLGRAIGIELRSAPAASRKLRKLRTLARPSQPRR